MGSITSIISTIALASSIFTGDPSAGVQANHYISPVGVHQIKEGNVYEGLVKLNNLENYAKKQSEKKIEWPHVLKEDPAPKPVSQPVHKQVAVAPHPVYKPAPRPVVAHKPAPQQRPTRIVTVRSTAYTASCEGCTGRTATGINLKANPNIKLIAVDPSVIPLGKRVYVEGYGYAITGDTGGAIHGNRIDIYMASKHDAINWGVRTVKVTVLN
jgi:3D (Asp-Asp-Asp) domain-containing protein